MYYSWYIKVYRWDQKIRALSRTNIHMDFWYYSGGHYSIVTSLLLHCVSHWQTEHDIVFAVKHVIPVMTSDWISWIAFHVKKTLKVLLLQFPKRINFAVGLGVVWNRENEVILRTFHLLIHCLFHDNFLISLAVKQLSPVALKIRISRAECQIYLSIPEAKVSKTESKIRISEGKSKLACILPSGSILGEAKDTNKCGQKQVCLHFAERSV